MNRRCFESNNEKYVCVLQKRQLQLTKCFNFKRALTSVKLCRDNLCASFLSGGAFSSALSAICELLSPLGVACRICLPSMSAQKGHSTGATRQRQTILLYQF